MAKRNLWKRKYEKAQQQIASLADCAISNARDWQQEKAETTRLRGHLGFLADMMRAQAEIISDSFPANATMLRNAADAYAPRPLPSALAGTQNSTNTADEPKR